MIIFISLLVMILGLLFYALSTTPKVIEIGRLMFGAGLLVFLLQINPHMISLIGGER